MSNFVFPQITGRTNRTQRSYRSNNGRNFILNGFSGTNLQGSGSTNANNLTMGNHHRGGLVERALHRHGGDTERNVISALSNQNSLQHA